MFRRGALLSSAPAANVNKLRRMLPKGRCRNRNIAVDVVTHFNQPPLGKRKRLNGLPNSLTQRYFSTLFYYSKGYMSDWILHGASELGITHLEIDLMNETVEPKEMGIKPIVAYLPRLKETISITLKKENFPSDFITRGIFEMEFSEVYNFLNCKAVLTDKEGKEYIGKTYTEFSYGDKFKVFKPNIIDRFKNILK